MKVVAGTCVSTGIGHVTSKVPIDGGFRVFGALRSREDADRPRAEFGGDFASLLFDVSDEAAIAEAEPPAA